MTGFPTAPVTVELPGGFEIGQNQLGGESDLNYDSSQLYCVNENRGVNETGDTWHPAPGSATAAHSSQGIRRLAAVPRAGAPEHI